MYITKAVKRLGWRFQKASTESNNTFRLNQNDIVALESISRYVEQTQKKQFENNVLFAKMYILCYMRILEKDNTTVFETFARRKLYGLLKLPISSMIEKFTEFLNEQQVLSLFEELNIKPLHPSILTEKEKANDLERLLEALETPENLKRFNRESWDYETVKNCLELEVNQAINFMNNYSKTK